ncbi:MULTISPECIES: Crp/Fnr family transcriptional regulator [Sphingobium]|uniref:Crp/Fnr family transcriptional regulator n=2 Tax=Sphingobium TaxID=165695 RepID=A0A437J3T7_9SPHN|nr:MULTISPECIES: helix-turn-helix domain-containing protein [Sphingobium]EQB12508.1 Crp/Fnr family transcription regulator [Sphingobium lactosutens DS20]RVT39208.1 Crp/Fnr family transcriptional regulator [Sphingobium algorifonticola]
MDMRFDMTQNGAFSTPARSCGSQCCNACVVRDRAICADLNEGDRDALSRLGRRVTLQAGQTVMWEGDDSMVVANVIEGTLKLATSTGDGREQIVGVVYAADFIGRPFGARTPHSVTALTNARLCLFPRGGFDGFAMRHGELQHRLLQRTLDDLDRTRAWMLLLGRKSAREKVATFLLDMSRRLHADRDGVIALPLSRQQIADILGITIETVSRQLTEMKRDGFIDLVGRRGVRPVNMAALEGLSEAA